MLSLLTVMGMAFASSGTVVIDLVDGTNESQLETLAEQNGLVDAQWVDPAVAREGLAEALVEDVDATVVALNNNPLVEIAEPQIEYRVTGELVSSSPNDPGYAKQWHMRKMDAEWVWENTSAGEGVVVAVLDTGFYMTSDFNPDQIMEGLSFVPGEKVTDGHGHGTHCAATIAEWTDNGVYGVGLAKEATIFPIKVLSNGGSGYNEWIAAGIYAATDGGANVISMSLGGGQSSPVMNKAIDYAIENGVVVVAAAGNSGCRDCVGWPAAYPPVIAIGSTGPTDVRAPYSSYGKGLDIMAPGGDKSKPGGGVFQLTYFRGKESFEEWQGTSMATPHAAAAAAVLLGEGAAPEYVESILKDTAKQVGPVDQYGAGLIDLKAAVGKVDSYKGSEATATPEKEKVLPHPNPAGKLTFVVTALTLVGGLLFTKVYSPSPYYRTAFLGAALVSSGPLFALTYLPVTLHGLALFMVPWVEVPEYLIAPGISGAPFWLSFLPLTVPFLLMAPFPKTRPLIAGLLLSTTCYLLVDAVTLCNPVWWMSSFGSACWLLGNALVTGVLLAVASEMNLRHRN